MDVKKVAAVTGAAGDIGKAIAIRLAKDGYDIAACDMRPKELAETVAEIEAAAEGCRCVGFTADVTDDEQVKKMFAGIKETFGRLDVMVNHAGICEIRRLSELTAETLRRMLDINVVSVGICSREAAAIMIPQGGGKIINASSQMAFRQSATAIEYGASKWAIRGMTRSLAVALAPYNITVNSYCPGKITGKMHDRNAQQTSLRRGITLEEYEQEELSRIPLGRMQTPEDVAALVSFLAGVGGDNITGQNIMVNGGMIMN